ncbi:MAG: hypothetical protein JSR44_01525 [Spirochaetes bacterium]|nr:hypothetical protein [Spirochaetota bacterium]
MRKFFIGAAMVALLAGCAHNGSSEAGMSDVSNAIQSQMSAVNSTTSDANAGSSSAIAYLAPWEKQVIEGQTFWQKIERYFDRAFDSSLHAILVSCNSGSEGDSPAVAFGSTMPFTVTRTWSNCVLSAGSGAFSRNGTVSLSWAGLQAASPYVKSGATLTRSTGTGLTMTQTSTGNYVTIVGNDTTNTAGGNNGNQHLVWTAANAFTLSMNATRTGSSSSGSTLFKHVVTTPTSLSITFNSGAGTRTIASGSINVHHAIANFDVLTTFNNAVWSASTCQPQSGSATVTVSGTLKGSGTLQFSSGAINFTYGSSSGTVTAPGC